MSAWDKNRAYWNRTSDQYQTAHGPELSRNPLAWGVWRIPEAELRVLGEVEGRDILELGCLCGAVDDCPRPGGSPCHRSRPFRTATGSRSPGFKS